MKREVFDQIVQDPEGRLFLLNLADSMHLVGVTLGPDGLYKRLLDFRPAP